uniref:Protein-S-isoprenylcysteine O-methyltransferase n=1 Tax=Plectus sambesii TaxID=2011161 RepID=A0A914WG30_9BILA
MLPELRVAVVSFLIGVVFMITAANLFLRISSFGDFLTWTALSSVPVFLSCAIFHKSFQVALRASGLGCAAAIGSFLWFSRLFPTFHPFGAYMCILSFFHWSEYVITAITSPRTLSIDSFLLNHSKAYWIAASASWLEFTLEAWLIPGLKSEVISWIGVLICTVGEILRKGAMLTARSNFTHLISTRKRNDHELITHGLYSLFRHPSYVGWFWWSIGTQIALVNPLCVVAYAVVSWRFFNERIYDEELYLINFFRDDYVHYQQRVPVGLPFIEGFKPEFSAP